MNVICAWCGITLRQVPDGAESPDSRDSHGICEACSTTLLETLGIPLGRFLSDLDVPVLLMSDDVCVLDASPGGLARLGLTRETAIGRMGGEVFECVHASLPGGCGRTVHCSGCALRHTVTSTWETGQPHLRVPATLDVAPEGVPRQADILISTAKVGDRVILKIETADRAPPRRGHGSERLSDTPGPRGP